MEQSIREYGLSVIPRYTRVQKKKKKKEQASFKFHMPNFCAAYFPGSELKLSCVRIVSAATRKDSSPGKCTFRSPPDPRPLFCRGVSCGREPNTTAYSCIFVMTKAGKAEELQNVEFDNYCWQHNYHIIRGACSVPWTLP